MSAQSNAEEGVRVELLEQIAINARVLEQACEIFRRPAGAAATGTVPGKPRANQACDPELYGASAVEFTGNRPQEALGARRRRPVRSTGAEAEILPALRQASMLVGGERGIRTLDTG